MRIAAIVILIDVVVPVIVATAAVVVVMLRPLYPANLLGSLESPARYSTNAMRKAFVIPECRVLQD